jgi:predicted nucleic acid-binding protein
LLASEGDHLKAAEVASRCAGRGVALSTPHALNRRAHLFTTDEAGAKEWPVVRAKLRALPIEVVPADELLAEQAEAPKATRKMPLADCFAAALAQQRRADLYTGDPEFRAVEKVIKIVWLEVESRRSAGRPACPPRPSSATPSGCGPQRPFGEPRRSASSICGTSVGRSVATISHRMSRSTKS